MTLPRSKCNSHFQNSCLEKRFKMWYILILTVFTVIFFLWNLFRSTLASQRTLLPSKYSSPAVFIIILTRSTGTCPPTVLTDRTCPSLENTLFFLHRFKTDSPALRPYHVFLADFVFIDNNWFVKLNNIFLFQRWLHGVEHGGRI